MEVLAWSLDSLWPHTCLDDIVCDSQRALGRYPLPSTCIAHCLELARSNDSHGGGHQSTHAHPDAGDFLSTTDVRRENSHSPGWRCFLAGGARRRRR